MSDNKPKPMMPAAKRGQGLGSNAPPPAVTSQPRIRPYVAGSHVKRPRQPVGRASQPVGVTSQEADAKWRALLQGAEQSAEPSAVQSAPRSRPRHERGAELAALGPEAQLVPEEGAGKSPGKVAGIGAGNPRKAGWSPGLGFTPWDDSGTAGTTRDRRSSDLLGTLLSMERKAERKVDRTAWRACGTSGCELAAYHDGVCKSRPGAPQSNSTSQGSGAAAAQLIPIPPPPAICSRPRSSKASQVRLWFAFEHTPHK